MNTYSRVYRKGSNERETRKERYDRLVLENLTNRDIRHVATHIMRIVSQWIRFLKHF